MGQAATQMAHHSLGKFYQTAGNPAPVHQFARQHKKRNCHKWKAVDAIIDIAVQQPDVALLPV